MSRDVPYESKELCDICGKPGVYDYYGDLLCQDCFLPRPGSPKAVEAGCSCAIVDNHYGLGFGFDEDGNRLFWINASCPVHGSPKNE